MTWLTGLFLKVARIRWDGKHWVQQGRRGETEVIPEFAMIGMLMLWFVVLMTLVFMAGWGILRWVL